MVCHLSRLALAAASMPLVSGLSCHVGVEWTYTGEACVLGSTGSITTQECSYSSADTCVTESYSQSVQGGACHLDYIAAACGTLNFDDCKAAETSFNYVDGGSGFACVSCHGDNCNPSSEIKYASNARRTAAGWLFAALVLARE
mmetsp:Transcript_12535/g.28277  ORF Transcript_12535/g.28277 Transcript_12535/m.28277 type:complete len:144 (+) Transcript_12535:57-488(+)|eukprot:240807-Amphidinium_carterae.1